MKDIASKNNKKINVLGKKNAWNFYCMDKSHDSLGLSSMSQKYKALSPKWKLLEKEHKEKFLILQKKDCERFNLEFSELSDNEKKLFLNKKKRKANTPKKGLSAYVYFMMDKRVEIKEKFNLTTFGDISRKMGEIWKMLSKEEKIMYFKKQTEDKERYDNEFKALQIGTLASNTS